MENLQVQSSFQMQKVVFPTLFFQINDLNQVPVPVMLLPDDFKANTKIKVNNHLFNKYLSKHIIILHRFSLHCARCVYMWTWTYKQEHAYLHLDEFL